MELWMLGGRVHNTQMRLYGIGNDRRESDVEMGLFGLGLWNCGIGC